MVGVAPAADQIVVALDLTDPREAVALAERLRPLGLIWFKVGLGLWIRGGREVVRSLQSLGAKVFLDLKLHDIPHQVRLATAAAAELEVDLLTIHAAGGSEMCRAAVEVCGGTRLLAITVLTSLPSGPGTVLSRAQLAHDAGVAGVVCSPLEVAALRDAHPAPFLLVTPGIRPAGAAYGDQTRVATPSAAIGAGSDLLVIGRPITQSADPEQAISDILEGGRT
jgi:orotidine-5'-phosphate decarboxylase